MLKASKERTRCPHQKQRSRCRECGGSQICKHQKERYSCKECGGGGICKHQKLRSQCKPRGGGSICDHGTIRSICKECGGGSICDHQKERSKCKECSGGGICDHQKRRSTCRESGGGSICNHQKRRSTCKKCKGASICEHGKQRRHCPICAPGHLVNIVSSRTREALYKNKELSSQEYLGCDMGTLWGHIEAQFTEGMSWENYGKEWHIDHKIPLKYRENGEAPLLVEVARRLHYTNTQPMWASENMSKGNRYISE